MGKVEDKLRGLGIELFEVPKPLGSYRPSVLSNNLIFVSGQIPIIDGVLKYKGKVGCGVSIEQGIQASRLAAINTLSVMRSELGSLDRVTKVIKVSGYVACEKGFHLHANVVNGASDLFYQVFGEKGKHARVAVGVYELPLGAPVEIDVISEFS